jgi:glycine hydroxymethyltransferase
MKEQEMAVIARLIVDVLRNIDQPHVIEKVKKKSRELCESFPIYQDDALAECRGEIE